MRDSSFILKVNYSLEKIIQSLLTLISLEIQDFPPFMKVFCFSACLFISLNPPMHGVFEALLKTYFEHCK